MRPRPRQISRPVRPPWLLIGILILLCGENLARVGLSLQQVVQLPTLPTDLSPVYVAVTSALCAIACAVCIVGAIEQRDWALPATVIVVVGYEVYLWVTRLAFARSPEVYATLGFRAIISAATLGVVFALSGVWWLKIASSRKSDFSEKSDI